MKKIIAIASIFGTFLGMPAFGQSDPDWQNTISVKNTEFDPIITVTGKETGEGLFNTLPARTWKLVSLVTKTTGEADYILVFFDSYIGDWRFWNSAQTNKAETLKTMTILQKTGGCARYTGCTHYESIAAVLPRSTLERAQTEDVKIRFSTRGAPDEQVVMIDRIAANHQLLATKAQQDLLKK